MCYAPVKFTSGVLMEKWIFLVVSLIMVYIAIEAVRWFLTVRKFSTRDIEKTVGYDGSKLPTEIRDRMANRHRLVGAPFTFVMMFVAVAIGVVIATIKAFLA